MSSTHSLNSPGDWLKQIQESLNDVRKALNDLGVHDGEQSYVDVFRSLRRADQLVADSMRRLDAGHTVSAEDFDTIAQLFEAIKSSVL
ncbi:MAG: hypothetical protein AB7F38_03890 [Piscinibacter sp.]